MLGRTARCVSIFIKAQPPNFRFLSCSATHCLWEKHRPHAKWGMRNQCEVLLWLLLLFAMRNNKWSIFLTHESCVVCASVVWKVRSTILWSIFGGKFKKKVKTNFCLTSVSRENYLSLISLYNLEVQKNDDKCASLTMLFIKCLLFW